MSEWFSLLFLLPIALFRFTAGCVCCGDGDPPIECTVYEDGFDLADGTNIGSGFTETTGDSVIDTGALKFTTTGAVVTCNTDSPNAERAIVVEGRATNANNLAHVRLGDYKIEVKFSATAGSVKILNAGGTTVRTSATNLIIPINTWLTISACYDGEYIEAEVAGVEGSFVQVSASISDLTNGLGTGSTVTGSVLFDNFELLELNDDCPCPFSPGGGDQGCVYCTGFQGPYYWMVTIGGVTNNICTHCDNWNGVYILAPNSNVFCFAVVENTRCCCWTAPNGGDACSENIPPNRIAGEFAQCTLQVCAAYDGFPAGIRVRMYHARTGGFFVFQAPIATPVDCLNLSNLNVPVLPSLPAYCTTTSATCHVTAL